MGSRRFDVMVIAGLRTRMGDTSGVTDIVSGEGVALNLERAGLGSRVVAASLDFVVQMVALIVVILLDTLLVEGEEAMLTALVLVELVLVLAGYPIIFEWLTRGRTLGKMALGLRVVRDDGGPIGFRQALVRGLSGLLLEKPGLIAPFGTAIGMGLIAFSASSKRLGDMMAGTFVVRERAGAKASLTPAQYSVPVALQPWAMSLDLSALNDQLALGVRQFVQRAAGFTPATRDALGEDFRAQVLARISPPPPPGVPTPLILTTVLAERRRRADLREAEAARNSGAFGWASWVEQSTNPWRADTPIPGQPSAAGESEVPWSAPPVTPDSPFSPPR